MRTDQCLNVGGVMSDREVLVAARRVVAYNDPLVGALSSHAPMAWRSMLSDLSEALDVLAVTMEDEWDEASYRFTKLHGETQIERVK